MHLGIEGRVAVVGGASSGLGRASAVRLVDEGCHVLLWARRAEPLAETARELRARSRGRVETLVADAADAGSAELVARRALEAFGQVDTLVLNAGGPPPTDPTVTDPDAMRAALQLLVGTPVELATRLLPGMRERRWGRIVAILSWGVREPLPGLVLSNVGRSGLAAWLKTTSRHVAAQGVTLNGVLPGRFATPRIASLDQARAEREGRDLAQVQADGRAEIPAGREGDPDELGSLVAYLCSEPAAYLTGAFIPVDGGLLRSLG